MARYLIVESGIVTNAIESGADFAASIGAFAHATADIGWSYANGAFSPPLAPAVALADHQANAVRALVAFINGITEGVENAYPSAEVKTWDIQKVEAERVVSAGASATLSDAPFLVGVCAAQFGPADNATRLVQVKEKAVAVKANADSWAGLAAFVNGLRARTHGAILDATDIGGVDAALAAGVAEGAAFKLANGL